jgi:hypothetical protein
MRIKRATIDPTVKATRQGVAHKPSVHDWDAVAVNAKTDPGVWFEYDGFEHFSSSRSPIRTYAKRINDGLLLTLAAHGKFEAIARGGLLYVRYIGESGA